MLMRRAILLGLHTSSMLHSALAVKRKRDRVARRNGASGLCLDLYDFAAAATSLRWSSRFVGRTAARATRSAKG